MDIITLKVKYKNKCWDSEGFCLNLNCMVNVVAWNTIDHNQISRKLCVFVINVLGRILTESGWYVWSNKIFDLSCVAFKKAHIRCVSGFREVALR